MALLILLGAFTKSAQFPFHFWLPNAMEAPTPVSAYLHSATMVKAGVYLVARFSPAFSGVPIWDNSVLVVGAITALTGGWLALQQVDLKRILAYSTVSALGTLMLLLGIGTPAATKAAVVLLLCHALYKAAFFLIAGTVDHCVGTRDIRKLGGLVRVMPWLATAAALAALSKAGVPPAGGFLAKELIYESTLKLSPWLSPVLLAVFLVNVSFVAVAVLLTIVPFFGTATPKALAAHHPGWRLVLPPLLLGGLGIVIGLFPGVVGQVLVAPAVAAVSPGAEGVYLKLWHGFNLALLLSLLTLAAGVGLFAIRQPRWQRLVSVFGAATLLGSAICLLTAVSVDGIVVVQLGNWPAPFGITIVADLFSAIMTLVAAVVGLIVLVYSLYGIDQQRQDFGFHSLLHLLLLGVCGAFLTGDIFNMYVWFAAYQLGFLVWGHHMFTSGQSKLSAIIFSALTFSVSIPSGIKVFNWLATMYKGSINLATPMCYALSFMSLFTIGGLTGLFLGALATDVHRHDTYFVVAHFHYVMMGGTLIAFLGGLHYWQQRWRWPVSFSASSPFNTAQSGTKACSGLAISSP